MMWEGLPDQFSGDGTSYRNCPENWCSTRRPSAGWGLSRLSI